MGTKSKVVQLGKTFGQFDILHDHEHHSTAEDMLNVLFSVITNKRANSFRALSVSQTEEIKTTQAWSLMSEIRTAQLNGQSESASIVCFSRYLTFCTLSWNDISPGSKSTSRYADCRPGTTKRCWMVITALGVPWRGRSRGSICIFHFWLVHVSRRVSGHCIVKRNRAPTDRRVKPLESTLVTVLCRFTASTIAAVLAARYANRSPPC
ncbi:Aquaporin-12A [Anopheles sinensis]|uniref:Aquaporin-12A n=1 Tax=Anopheles sinensis TaxID=74873 RepID=A0A084WDE6_ANOSI|nr:Aquaporin-12A [Anopheles sinensis]